MFTRLSLPMLSGFACIIGFLIVPLHAQDLDPCQGCEWDFDREEYKCLLGCPPDDPSMCAQAECEVHDDGTCEQGIGGCTYTMVPRFDIAPPLRLLESITESSKQSAVLWLWRQPDSPLPLFHILV